MTVLTLQPDATAGVDSYLALGTPTFNFGVGGNFGAGAVTVNEPRRGLLKFDISSLPAGATLNSAILTLFCESESATTDRTVGAHRGLTQWFEGAKNGAAPDASQDGSTWNLRNANGALAWGAAGGQSGTDYAATATDSKIITVPSTAFDYNVLADVQAWYAATATNYGWWLICTAETVANSLKRFTSSDGATAANWPKLVIDYTEAGGQAARTIEIGGQFGVMMLPTGGAGMMMIN